MWRARRVQRLTANCCLRPLEDRKPSLAAARGASRGKWRRWSCGRVASPARSTRPPPPTLRLRAVQVQRRGFRRYRLSTSLPNPVTAPAAELARLYHDRWELELAAVNSRPHSRPGRSPAQQGAGPRRTGGVGAAAWPGSLSSRARRKERERRVWPCTLRWRLTAPRGGQGGAGPG